MGAAPSHEQQQAQPPPRPPLGRRPTNPPAAPPDAAIAPTFFREGGGRTVRDLRPIEYRPPVQQSEIVRNVVNLVKRSLRLVRCETENVWLVEFEFDAEVEGYITIYYAAREFVQREGERSGKDAPVVRVSYQGTGELPGRTPFGIGRKQKYRQKVEKGLNLETMQREDMIYGEGDKYPVVIRLEAKYGESSMSEGGRVKSQTTFAEIVEEPEGWGLRVIAQQVLLGGTIYRMRELYGIGAKDVTATKRIDEGEYRVDSTHECVICLTEPCNTAVLPCNHLCLCDDCARILCTETEYQRRKCPVCRAPLASLLRIISGGDESSSADASSTIPDTAAATVARTVSDVPSTGTAEREAERPAEGNTLIV